MGVIGYWQQVESMMPDSVDPYLIIDDSVRDTPYSTKIEMVKV
jgi:hypothetical protein